MFRKCTPADTQRVLEYIGDEYVKCFYMYMDIIECGIEDEGLGLWISEEDGEIACVYYQYYDCLHIFSRKGYCDEDAVLQLVGEIDPKVISSSEDIIDQLRKHFPEEDYMLELNHIITANKEMTGGAAEEIIVATREDIPEIARLVLKADIFSDV